MEYLLYVPTITIIYPICPSANPKSQNRVPTVPTQTIHRDTWYLEPLGIPISNGHFKHLNCGCCTIYIVLVCWGHIIPSASFNVVSTFNKSVPELTTGIRSLGLWMISQQVSINSIGMSGAPGISTFMFLFPRSPRENLTRRYRFWLQYLGSADRPGRPTLW